jgi:hypothetical protein
MTIDAKHKAYIIAQARWKKVRDFVGGGPLVKPYIIPLPGHDIQNLAAYRERAYYLPAIARSIDAFTGMIMNPEPVITAPDVLTAYLDDVSYDGEPAARMIGRTVREVVEVGRCAVLVDYPQGDNAAQLSVAEAEAQGLRAYARFYKAEDVLDWRTTSRGGERVLSFLKLRETFDQVSDLDEWTVTLIEQIRVLDLVPGGAGLRYRQRIYQKGEIKDQQTGRPMSGWTQIGGDIFPQANGATLNEIPAVVFNPDTLDATELDDPPTLEMVEIACAHLQNSASLEWTIMWVGNPTPVFVNLIKGDGETIALGSSQGIVVGEGGDAKFMTLGGDGIEAIRKPMEDKRRDMAAVGARLLADETSSQISRDTAIIQRAGEHSVLANIASTVSDGWRRVLDYLAMWAGAVDQDISVKLNTDFVPQGLTAGELTEWIGAVQSGHMSSRDLFALMQKRGVVRADKSYDEHLDEVDEDGERVLSLPPGTPGAPVAPPANDPNDEQDAEAA